MTHTEKSVCVQLNFHRMNRCPDRWTGAFKFLQDEGLRSGKECIRFQSLLTAVHKVIE